MHRFALRLTWQHAPPLSTVLVPETSVSLRKTEDRSAIFASQVKEIYCVPVAASIHWHGWSSGAVVPIDPIWKETLIDSAVGFDTSGGGDAPCLSRNGDEEDNLWLVSVTDQGI